MYLNKDAIIQDIKDAAIESVLKNVGGAALGGLGGGALTGDVPSVPGLPAGENAAVGGPTGFGIPNF